MRGKRNETNWAQCWQRFRQTDEFFFQFHLRSISCIEMHVFVMKRTNDDIAFAMQWKHASAYTGHHICIIFVSTCALQWLQLLLIDKWNASCLWHCRSFSLFLSLYLSICFCVCASSHTIHKQWWKNTASQTLGGAFPTCATISLERIALCIGSMRWPHCQQANNAHAYTLRQSAHWGHIEHG